MMRGLRMLLAVAVLLAVPVSSAFAGYKTYERAKCRVFTKKYACSARAGCLLPPIPIVSARYAAGCGDISVATNPVACIAGSAFASAYAGPSGCGGFAYAPGTGVAGLTKGGDELQSADRFGRQDLTYMVSYDSIAKQVTIDVSSLTMAASRDSNYSAFAIEAFTSADSTDTLYSPSKVFWFGRVIITHGKVLALGNIQEGDLTIQESADSIQVQLSSFVRTINFTGSQQEFDNIQVLLQGDAGQLPVPSEYYHSAPAAAPWALPLAGLLAAGLGFWRLHRVRGKRFGDTAIEIS